MTKTSDGRLESMIPRQPPIASASMLFWIGMSLRSSSPNEPIGPGSGIALFVNESWVDESSSDAISGREGSAPSMGAVTDYYSPAAIARRLYRGLYMTR